MFVVELQRGERWVESMNDGLRRSFETEMIAQEAINLHRSVGMTYRVVPEKSSIELYKDLTKEEQALESEVPKIKTTISRDKDSGHITISCSRALPSPSIVVHCLQLENRKKIKTKSYWTIQDYILDSYGQIPLQDWADAICVACMQEIGNEAGVTSELNHIKQGGYLAMGDTLYKLSAVAALPQTKALAATRRKLREAVNFEITMMRDSAKATSDALIRDAARIKHDAEEAKRLALRSTRKAPPNWMVDSHTTMRWGTDAKWQAQIIINFQIVAFDVEWTTREGIKRFSWSAKPSDSRKIRLWVPIQSDEGLFSATSIMVDKSDPVLPHISNDGACMGLSHGPKLLKNATDLESLRSALEHVHNRVNLSSLYTPFQSMVLHFRKAIPDEILAVIDMIPGEANSTLADKLVEVAKKHDVPTITHAEERNATWTA